MWKRTVIVMASAWVLFPGYLCPHTGGNLINNWIVGVGLAVFGTVAYGENWARYLTAALAIWLFAFSALTSADPHTVWNAAACFRLRLPVRPPDDSGYQAIRAIHGGDALEKLKSLSPLPGVILLDLMMPAVDGPTFRERQLCDPRLSAIPVIVLSAYRGVAKRAAELNVEDHLDKPLKVSTLLHLLQKHCPVDG